MVWDEVVQLFLRTPVSTVGERLPLVAAGEWTGLKTARTRQEGKQRQMWKCRKWLIFTMTHYRMPVTTGEKRLQELGRWLSGEVLSKVPILRIYTVEYIMCL